jgi:DNA-binding GntR family transcriptional regulator
MRRAALRVSRQDLTKAQRTLDAMTAARAKGDDQAVALLNRSFHFVFYDKVGIASLKQTIEDLWLDYPWDILQVIPGLVDHSMADHQRMLDAVVKHDLDAIANTTEQHIVSSFRALAEHLRGNSEEAEREFSDPFEPDND